MDTGVEMLGVLTDAVIIKQNLTRSSHVKTTTDLMACQNKTKEKDYASDWNKPSFLHLFDK